METEIYQGMSIVSAMAKAEVDHQVEVANDKRRSVTQFMKECVDLVGLSEAVAQSCVYALPRKDRRGGEKNIVGPSVRLAEIVLSSWRNCRVAARILDDTGDYVLAQGVFIDMEKNVATSREVRRRITDRNGRRYSADMIMQTANAACSIAARNATFSGVPRAYWEAAYLKAMEIIAGDAETLGNKRLKALDAFQKLGVSAERVYASLEVAGIEDITGEHLLTLRGIYNAIREGDVTIEEEFPEPGKEPKAPENAATASGSGVAGLKIRLASDATVEAAAGSTPVAEAGTDEVGAKIRSELIGKILELSKGEGIKNEPELMQAFVDVGALDSLPKNITEVSLDALITLKTTWEGQAKRRGKSGK